MDIRLLKHQVDGFVLPKFSVIVLLPIFTGSSLIRDAIQIKPTALDKESFWAKTNENQFATDDLFNELKVKFASAKKATDGDGTMAKKVSDKKKVKKPIIIQDEKILQALGMFDLREALCSVIIIYL
jgi:hypothetical protein